MIKLTAIIPAYNEELAIGSIIIGSKKHVERVIVVDDGSVDNTVEIAKLAGADVISHETNKGKGAALKTGLLAARNSDVIVTLDSDGQHNYDEIPKLIAPIIDGEADVVNGSRYLKGDKKDTPRYRRVGQTVLDKATKVSSGFDITDSQSGFRAFARHTIPAFRFKCDGFGIESEMLMDAANAGLRIKEVEIGVRYDLDGSTKNPVTHGFGVLMNIINDLEFQRPLLFFTLPGVIISITGITLGLIFFGDYLAQSNSIAGVPSASKSLMPTVLAIMLTLGGGFLALTGIILDSMSKMINHVLNNSNHTIPSSNIDHGIKIETPQDLRPKTGK